MKVIWKYDLSFEDGNITVPKDAELLDVQVQMDKLAIWFLVDSEKEKEDRAFITVGTGNEMPYYNDVALDYLKTIQSGRLVWHIFEVRLNNVKKLG